MINFKKVAPVLILALAGFAGCNKDIGSITGIWEVDFVRAIHVAPRAAADLPNLCINGGTLVLAMNGTVDRHFHGNATKRQDHAALVQGNRSDNRDNFTSIEHYTDCNYFSVNVNNRSVFGAMFNNSSDGYARVEMDSNNRCVVRVKQNRDHRYVRIDVGYVGQGSYIDAQGNTIYDTNNRLSGFTYDCEGGGYTSYLVHHVENGEQNKLSGFNHV